MKQTKRVAVGKLYSAIEKARQENPILMIEAYCRKDCPVREVLITIKDLDDDFLPRLQSHGLLCPLCGGELAIHYATARNHKGKS